ncbi:hypothetical protein MB02_11845 [Croceicoccus estronivorus]|uniref:phosphotransferase family protein n=1 Tax=Croceicoccus estronivorus TaxID=1172626 RepID=UPI00082C7649|nr:phosphotransferase family protein [Croceicoccus estronivorus]OCC23321.1 hypothetical protein MB02_11845 [Croceicoccus estronivorus]
MTAFPTSVPAVHHALAQVLQSLRADLRDVLVPELGSEGAKTTSALMDEMLGWVAVGLGSGEGKNYQSEINEKKDNPDEWMRDYLSGGELYSDPDLAHAHAALAVSARTGGDCAREAVLIEEARLADEDRRAKDFSDGVPELQPPVEAERLQAWFASEMQYPNVGHVTSISQVVGGYSKDTWMIEISGELAGYSNLVLRRDLPFGPGENSVSEEHALLLRLSDAGVPVPRPLAGDVSTDAVDAPFLIFPRLPGKAVFGDWQADGEEKAVVARDVAICMAQFHTLKPSSVGLAEVSRASAVAGMVAQWRGKWERRRLYPSAILEAAYAWLAANVPDSDEPARLVHGDVSFRNTLIDNGRLTGLLDWEFAHAGDPVEDLSYFQLVAEPHVDWMNVLQAYRDAGGEVPDVGRAKFYEIWRSTRNATTTATAWYGLVNGLYPASKAAYQGLALYRFFLRDIASKLKDVL